MAVAKTQGAVLQLSIASVYTTVAQRVRIKPNDSTRNKLETTDLDSTAETSVSGIIREGEVELEVFLDTADATHAAIWTLKGSGAVGDWKIIYADTGATVDAFSAWISGISTGEFTTDGLQKATIKTQITGLVVRTP